MARASRLERQLEPSTCWMHEQVVEEAASAGAGLSTVVRGGLCLALAARSCMLSPLHGLLAMVHEAHAPDNT